MGWLRVGNLPVIIGVIGLVTLAGYSSIAPIEEPLILDKKPAALSRRPLVNNSSPPETYENGVSKKVAPSEPKPVVTMPAKVVEPLVVNPTIKIAASSQSPRTAAQIPANPVLASQDAQLSKEASNEDLAGESPKTASDSVQLDMDPFADGGAVVARPKAEHTGETVSPEDLKKFPGIEILPSLGIPIPTIGFTLDTSDEAKAARAAERIAEYENEGLPTEVAKLKAQLVERELLGKATRAQYSRKRSIVRLIQEAKLKKDAEDREARMMLLQLKQESVQKQMAEEQKLKEEAEAQKDAERRDRDAKLAAERKQLEETKAMMAKMRMDAVLKQQQENAERKKEEKESKKEEAIAREERDQKERESKRKMMEDFQMQMQAQLEDQKRLAREERIREAEEARKSRLAMEQNLGLKKAPLVEVDSL